MWIPRPTVGRRWFVLGGAGLAGAGLAAIQARAAESRGGAKKGEPAVSPGEDLMREHGVLRRVLLVYDEAGRRLRDREDLPLSIVADGAGLIRRVIENYHEKLEEDFLFPRFEKAGRLVGLVRTLRVQHQAGRAVTADIARLAAQRVLDDGARAALAAALASFTRMYRPHAAREDTVLFPAFHEMLGDKAYLALGETFEERETKVLGEGGFERAVADVARLEDALGIGELAQFTPPARKPP